MAATINSIATFLFILFIPPFVIAGSPSSEFSNASHNKGLGFTSSFNPSTAIIAVLLISSFFFLAFFSIYIRNCNNERSENSPTATGFVQFQHAGLNRQLLLAFPTMVYSEVKPHKIEKNELQCAICLSEFDDEDVIRLLPACDHVFHLDCIDAWLATHVTCPVCRTNYNFYSPAAARPELVLSPEAEVAAQHVAIGVDDVEGRKEEMRELAVLGNKVRRNGARRSKRLSRCHSTGHLTMGEGGGSFNRYTLRLPENLRKEIVAAGSLHKVRTFTAVNAGEGSSRRGRTIHLGRSDRWPSFFRRSLSARISLG